MAELISATPEWAALEAHAAKIKQTHLRDLFKDDPARAGRYQTTVGDLVIDYSRQQVTDETIELLLELAEKAGLQERIQATLNGEPVNTTENRAALHTALRLLPLDTSQDTSALPDPLAEAAQTALKERKRMAEFVQAVDKGVIRGSTDEEFKTLVNIGIGGSHLGPQMAYHALAHHHHTSLFRATFCANLDFEDWADARFAGHLESTLFVVTSKSFTTPETLANLAHVKEMINEDWENHYHIVAVTAAPEEAAKHGIPPEHIFNMWDWVGGRYSLASVAGLSLMLTIGVDAYEDMLAGMRSVDVHFQNVSPERNAAIIGGLLAVWNRNFMGYPTRAVLPYSHLLRYLPDYLQQLEMESNGKSVTLDGTPVDYETAPIVWGGTGTNSQHSFHQLLHQGTQIVPVDFICANDMPVFDDELAQQDALIANILAQAAALAFGSNDDSLALHRALHGNRPSSIISVYDLNPNTLGQLIALYEHQVLVQGAIWGINSFDQFGVEHGKHLADQILNRTLDTQLDPATKNSLEVIKRQRNRKRLFN